MMVLAFVFNVNDGPSADGFMRIDSFKDPDNLMCDNGVLKVTISYPFFCM